MPTESLRSSRSASCRLNGLATYSAAFAVEICSAPALQPSPCAVQCVYSMVAAAISDSWSRRPQLQSTHFTILRSNTGVQRIKMLDLLREYLNVTPRAGMFVWLSGTDAQPHGEGLCRPTRHADTHAVITVVIRLLSGCTALHCAPLRSARTALGGEASLCATAPRLLPLDSGGGEVSTPPTHALILSISRSPSTSPAGHHHHHCPRRPPTLFYASPCDTRCHLASACPAAGSLSCSGPPYPPRSSELGSTRTSTPGCSCFSTFSRLGPMSLLRSLPLI